MRLHADIYHALKGYEKIAVWGASGMGRRAMQRWLPRDKVRAIIDSDPAKEGNHFFGIEVHNGNSVDLDQFDIVVTPSQRGDAGQVNIVTGLDRLGKRIRLEHVVREVTNVRIASRNHVLSPVVVKRRQIAGSRGGKYS